MQSHRKTAVGLQLWVSVANVPPADTRAMGECRSRGSGNKVHGLFAGIWKDKDAPCDVSCSAIRALEVGRLAERKGNQWNLHLDLLVQITIFLHDRGT